MTAPSPNADAAGARRGPARGRRFAFGNLLLRGLLDVALPQSCVVCDRIVPSTADPLCDTCRRAIDDLRRLPCCPRCARTMHPAAIHGHGCRGCRTERYWNVAGLVRVAPYEESLRRMLIRLKHSRDARPGDLLGRLLAEELRRRWIDQVEALVPVPMHWLRRWQRPREHALALAQAVARELGVPVQRAAVRRVKYAQSQMRLSSREQRFENVRNCFGPARRPNVAGKTVCIIDNLVVTGATIHEVSKVLRRAGAKRIYAAVVARATPPGGWQADPAALLAGSVGRG